MTVTLEIPHDIEARLLADARASGLPLSDFVRDFIVEHYEEIEDWQVATVRLDNPLPLLSAEQVRKILA